MRLLAYLVAYLIIGFARFITAVRANWRDEAPRDAQTIYFANHTSNGDFILIWAVLPPRLRWKTRPVAAADYWLTSPIRSYIGRQVINAVLIDRRPEARTLDPVDQMAEALDGGASLIIFPEGRRNDTGETLLPFKTGIYHVAKKRPDVRFVPVWIENLNRALPRGEVIPIPYICTCTFGAAMQLRDGETKEQFLTRAQDAVLALAPGNGETSDGS
ncbi:lysophospholipid acyltransferase family protein [uncultured Roseovarius sp.]|uniref:lysophospholipid acyltransferase family protein n=1 Tax=uncultured Roseovarius sp. TaxID=293344 RepID=UPI00260E8055|nr:lysophospholipid acyltransferase family protein [uncultured Roseovarius sp.]